MKKISVISVLIAFVMPVFAEEFTQNVEQMDTNTVATANAVNAATGEEIIPTVPQISSVQQYNRKSSNPKTKFPRGLQLGIGVSPTSGLNGFIGYNNKNFDSFWAKRFGVRFDFASYSPIKNRLNSKINNAVGDEGVEIDDNLHIENMTISAKHVGALIDFYPFGNTWFLGGWRLSGGYMTGNLDLTADIHGKSDDGKIKFELGDDEYYYENGEMLAKAGGKWKYSGPYAGTGFDLGLFFGFKIYMDAGVVFANRVADIDFDVPLDGLKHANTGTDVTQEELNVSKDKALADARKELDKYPYYPLVKIGFMYRF